MLPTHVMHADILHHQVAVRFSEYEKVLTLGRELINYLPCKALSRLQYHWYRLTESAWGSYKIKMPVAHKDAARSMHDFVITFRKERKLEGWHDGTTLPSWDLHLTPHISM